MATGRKIQLTKQIGEYLVCAELCKRGFYATTFSGNIPYFDVVATNDKNETKFIQVKTIRHGDWQLNAKSFLDISFPSVNKQKVNGKKIIPIADLICIFVKLDEKGKDEFYIFKWKNLQNRIFKGYSKYLEKIGGKRRKNPKSTHTKVSLKDLKKYRDNWKLPI